MLPILASPTHPETCDRCGDRQHPSGRNQSGFCLAPLMYLDPRTQTIVCSHCVHGYIKRN